MIEFKDYKKYFTNGASLPCLQAEFLLKGSLAKAGMMVIGKENFSDTFLIKKAEKNTLLHGLDLYTDQERYEKYLKDFKDYVELAKKTIIPKYKEVPKKLTKKEFEKDVEFVGKLWKLYGFAEFSYTELAYHLGNEETKKNLDEISKFKFKAREIMNQYFFKKGVITNMVEYCGRNFLRSDLTYYMYLKELLDLFDGIKPDIEKIEKRRHCYGAAIINRKIVELPHSKALEIHNEFHSYKNVSEVKGVTARSGVARGKVVIAPLLDNYEEIERIDKIMNKGDVLIAETTSPDMMVLCNKASAIVAEQGGMLSHAAVVSRELGIPTIIQCQFATKIFKEGDMVEVDANKGVVKRV
jgi:phosphohistidine swiveling domain-containing protein